MSLRPVRSIKKSRETMEGAGVHLYRAFGSSRNAGMTDPFLLLDHFQSELDSAMSAGFPWHPHRGIETITYMIEGSIEHQDSLGNSGVISGGDVQWMTAGSGIIHQEMPRSTGRGQHGFQLWANLPSRAKMTDPRYQDIGSNEVPEVIDDDGTRARIITGEFWGRKGPVTGIEADPRYLDITVPANTERSIRIPLEHNAFAYVFQGSGSFLAASAPVPAPTEYVGETGSTEPIAAHPVENRNLVFFDTGDEVSIQTRDEPMRFLLVSGPSLNEPIAWHGPIVMNTEEELTQAFREYEAGTFLKHRR